MRKVLCGLKEGFSKTIYACSCGNPYLVSYGKATRPAGRPATYRAIDFESSRPLAGPPRASDSKLALFGRKTFTTAALFLLHRTYLQLTYIERGSQVAASDDDERKEASRTDGPEQWQQLALLLDGSFSPLHAVLKCVLQQRNWPGPAT